MTQQGGTARMPAGGDGGFKPDAVRAWLQRLPGDARTAGRALTDFLAALQRAELSVQDRLQVLEALRGPVLRMLVDLDVILCAAPQPLRIEDRDVLFLARQLAEAMAKVYERAVAQWPQAPRRERPPLAPALLHAVQFAGEVLLASFRSYSRVPEGSWKRLHAFYVAAESQGVATGTADAGSRQSVTDAYGEVLLVAVTDPYRLPPGELDRVLSLLRRLRAPVTLTREPPASRPSGHFLVAGDVDQAPRSAMVADEDAGGPNWRFLDANPVVERLRELMGDLDAGRSPAAVAAWPAESAREALVRLARLWEDPPQRAMRRDSGSGSVAICVGVKPIAHFVAHDAGTDEEAESAALRERLTMPLRALPQDEAGQLIPIHEWNVVNLSAGGMKVRRTAATSHPIAVGEIVGIKTPGKSLWTIGVTRWITALDDGTTEFGVQFFADAACAVWMKVPSPSVPPRLAILVTFSEDANAEALLAPAGAYVPGLEVEVRGEGLRYRARAVEAIERNAHFDLFRIAAG